MKQFFLLFVILITGCDGCAKIKKAVGLEIPSLPSEEREEAAKRLRDGDALVQSFTDQINQPDSNGGFKRYEGLTETDPWGIRLKVDYKQDGINEIMTVRSAGPDAEFDTKDDLIRTRSASNFWGFHKDLSFGQWIFLVWIASSILGTLLYLIVGTQRFSHGKQRKHPFLGVFFIFLFGPFAFVFCVLAAVAGSLGEGFDFDLGDIDLPFGD